MEYSTALLDLTLGDIERVISRSFGFGRLVSRKGEE